MRPNITLSTCINNNFSIDVGKNLLELVGDHKVVVISTDIPSDELIVDIIIKYNGSCKCFVKAIDEALTYNEDIVVIGCESSILNAIVNPYLTHIRILTDFTGTHHLAMGTLPRQKHFAKLIPNLNIDMNDETINITNLAELKYLDLLKSLLTANERPNRTDTLTQGTFVELLKFPLYDIGGRVLPLITTKKVPFDSVYEELKMFVLGETTTERLDRKKIPIWSGNTSREFLDNRGLHDYPVGTLGPVYGFQWSKFGADWTDPNSVGINQLQNVIDTLKTNPGDRRMLVSAWNPLDLNKMVLPPCHTLYQFHCDFNKINDKFIPAALNCVLYMRSADLALGVPFNIASYAMLTHIISAITGITPGTLAIIMTDCHIYSNHIDGIKKQLNRLPKRFPHINFLSPINNINDIKDVKFNISGYVPDAFIKLPMAV